MKISLNKIRFAHEHYGSDGLVDGGVDALVEKIGAQLGAVEEVTDLSHRFDGVVIVKIISCENHPNADRLHVCTIDDGGITPDVKRDENGHVQVVCGAPNVRAGLLVAWLPPGSTVPESRDKDPFVLGARELRGITSNGMLASPRELTIGDDHDGILEVDVDAEPGTLFAEAYRAEGEMIIDIENKMFTHRPDCFGTMGIIREIAGIQGKAFKSPDWYMLKPKFPGVEGDELKLTVKNELPELVPRFTAMAMSNVQIKPSPVWLQIVLSEVGIRPINNVVDYTNFWMLETGQPLHAYDYDKVKALTGGGDTAEITVRQPKPGEKIKLLNGKEIEPRGEAIMIAADKHLIGVGGVMGGSETEVDENTSNIILEAATFDMYSIRRTSMSHGLFTDAVTRFNKGQSPLQNLAVLSQAVKYIGQDAGARVASPLVDVSQMEGREWVHPPVTVTTEFINSRLGFGLSADEMRTLLENVEFKVDVDGDKLVVAAPFWRTDVELREDVVEEIGRLYGFDELPLELPNRSIKPVSKDGLLELKSHIRATLVKAGANEVLTYSFVHGNLLDRAGQDKTRAFQVGNALSPDLQYYRLSLIPSLLDKVHSNVKAGYDRFALFELGKAHINTDKDLLEETIPDEKERLALVYSSAKELSASPGAAYYQARKFMFSLVANLGLESEGIRLAPLTPETYNNIENLAAWFAPFEANRSTLVYYDLKELNKKSTLLGVVGEFKLSVRKALKLPAHTAGFELDTAVIRVAQNDNRLSQYVALPRFPKVTQDITLKVPAELLYQDLYDLLQGGLDKAKPDQTLLSLDPLGVYQRDNDRAHKQVTFRLTIASYERTLTDVEVAKLLDVLAAAASDKLGAEKL